MIFLFGLWDDLYRLSPRWKLLGQILATTILLSQGVHIRMLGSLTLLNVALTLLWTIGITNAFNFVDSMDGLAVGLAAIASAFFMLVTVDASQPALSLLSAVILGSAIGLSYFNTLPAHTFLRIRAKFIEVLITRNSRIFFLRSPHVGYLRTTMTF